AKINVELSDNIETLDYSTYEKNWICIIDADKLETELPKLKIGKNAVTFYQDEIERYIQQIKEKFNKDEKKPESFELYWGQLENLDEKDWYIITSEFFKK
ncbi:MAG: histidine kinase, partial [Ignavibacteriae bacterium HGW-Ignavibacteriae-3]